MQSMPKHKSTIIGYARVSTDEQNLDLQLDALNNAGCSKIFTDQLSGAKTQRPGLTDALNYLRAGDTLVVWKLDRLGRSLKDLIEHVEHLKSKEIEFKSLNESIDTASPTGKFTFHLFSALAEFERDLIRDRTRAGLAAARARGRIGGRKKALSPAQVKTASMLMKGNEMSIKEICRLLKISRSTLYRYVAPDGTIRKTKGS